MLPPKSEFPKIRGGGGGRGKGVLQPPSPNGTYAYGCYHLFFQLNNGFSALQDHSMFRAVSPKTKLNSHQD